MKDVIVVIPSLNPDQKLIEFVKKLIENGFQKLVIVDDGSDEKYKIIFNELEKKKECILLSHDINKGKGQALKTAFEFILKNYPKCIGVVSADCDGQHLAKDVLKLAVSLSKNGNSAILGTRDFNQKNVPFKSRYGNKITSFLFQMKYKKYLKDTQTGLRAIPVHRLNELILISGEKFDYELNMLIYLIKKHIKIVEVNIETIYIDKNKKSHFKIFKDSINIYKALFKRSKL